MNENNDIPRFIFTFHPQRRELFRNGGLGEHWVERYPELFDMDDRRILKTELQRQYHFYEFLSSILLFESTGYRSLIENYESKAHPNKRDILFEKIGPDLFDWVASQPSGQPDLFVYGYEPDDWFFCEVKGPGDNIRKNQKEWSESFEEKTGRKVCLFELKEIKQLT